MNEQELSSLSIEISEIARSIKIYFKNSESLQENISQLNEFEQRLIGINKKIKAQDSTINKIISSIKEATENVTSTSVNTIKTTAKVGLNGVAIVTKLGGLFGSKIAGNAIPINILSQIAEFTIENLSDLLGDKLENISEQIQIISKEQKITEKEAIKQLTIAFSIKVEQLIFQCTSLKAFINTCIEDNLFFQKITTLKFPKLETLEKELKELTQEIKKDFRLREIEVIEQQLEQIKNAQRRFFQIEEELSNILEIIRTKTSDCIVFDSEAMENLITTLNQEIIYIRICPNHGIALCLTGKEETLKDIEYRFNSSKKNVRDSIVDANKRYDRAKTILCQTKQKKKFVTHTTKEKDNSKQENTETSKEIIESNTKKEFSKSKGNSLIPILMWLIVLSFGSWIGWNFFNSRQVQNKAEQLLAEVQDIDKTSDIHNLQTYQDKIKKSILLLETIPDAPGSDYKKVNNDISKLHSQLTAVEQKIKDSNQLSEQANKDLEAAESLAMQASVIVQNPPHPLEVWQQAQGKWQESIKLLEAIPENLPAYIQAQEKLVTYQTNYAALTKRIEIEQNASNTINNAEDLAKQSVELVKATPYTIEVLKNAQEKLKEAMDLLKSVPSGTAVSAKAESLMQVYSRNSQEIQDKLDKLEFCNRLNMTSCIDAEIPLNFK